MYKLVQESIDDLKSNSSEVWQRLATDECRMDKLESVVSRVEVTMAEKMDKIQEWLVEFTTIASLEIPREIVNSLQEVINDSAPEIAVDIMRRSDSNYQKCQK